VSEHLIIYLDESGGLGFDFDNPRTNRYFVIAILVCLDNQVNKTTIQAVKKTLRNKLPKNTIELKGSNLAFAIKKYFLKEMNKTENWCLYAAIADKKTWLAHHNFNHSHALKKKTMYDEVAKRIFSQVTLLDNAKRVDIVIDRSKNKDEITEFNVAVTAAIRERLPSKSVLNIRHAFSHEEHGLQAIDTFCTGIWRKYEKNDLSWFVEFSDKMAAETIHKF